MSLRERIVNSCFVAMGFAVLGWISAGILTPPVLNHVLNWTNWSALDDVILWATSNYAGFVFFGIAGFILSMLLTRQPIRKKAFLILGGVATVPLALMAGSYVFYFLDREFLSKGRIWEIDGAQNSLFLYLYTGACALPFLIVFFFSWIRISRRISPSPVAKTLGPLT